MAGKNNAAVIAGIGKISTPRVTNGRSIDFAGAVDSFLRGYDWGDNLRKQKEQEANREALALALQAEDEAQIADAWAKFDPMGYAERLDKIKEARIKREQALADAEAEHNRNVALEELRNRLGIKRDEATHSRTMALEKLKRDWSLEDKGLERQQQLEDKALERERQLEDAEAKRQDFYAQTAFEKDLEAQYKKQNPEKLPNAIYYANELDKLDENNPEHQPRIKILKGLLAKEMAISGGKSNIAKEIQLINMRAGLDPNDPVQAEQIKLIDGILVGNKQGTKAKELQLIDRLNSLDPNDPNNIREINLLESALSGNQQQQKDTRTKEERFYDFLISKGFSPEEALELSTKTGKYAPNQGKKEKTLEQIANEEKTKTKSREEAKNEVEQAAALGRLKNKYGLFEKKAAPLLKELKTGDADGLGEIEYYLASGSRPFAKGLNEGYYERASINQQAINDLNNLMRDMARDVMTAQNINARQADTTWEQKHLFYDIAPDMDEIRLRERINALKEYLQLVLKGDTSYTPEEKPQVKPEVKIKSIMREK